MAARKSGKERSTPGPQVDRVLGKGKPKDIRWYREDECHEAVFEQVRRIGHLTRARRRQDLYYACMYDDAELASLIQGSQAIGEFTPQTMVTNIVRRQVDAFVSRIAKNRPVPMALTNGGNHSQQQRGKKLTKFFEGVLDSVKFWETRQMRLRDGAVFGSGLAHNYRIGKKLVHERFYPWELRVDPREAMYRCPRTLYRTHYVDRLVLMERYPKHAEAILQADSRFEDDPWEVGYDETSDLVAVVTAWHLPTRTGDDAKFGAYAVCVSNATLERADYIRDYFPISKFDFSPGIAGWWGEGMAKQLAGLQFEVNSIGLRLQEQAWMTGTYVWAGPDAGVEVDLLDNGTLTVINSAVEPKFHNPSPFPPGFLDYYMNLRGRFPAEETRISEMSTRGELPPGMESGRAIRAWNNLDDQAFLTQGREDERDVIDTCWQLFDLAEEIEDDPSEGAYEIRGEARANGKSVLQRMQFAKVRLDRDAFDLRTFPTSFLTGTPAEKYDQLQQLMKDGLVSQDEALALIDFPDIQRVLSLRGAARRAVEKILEDILDAESEQAAAKAYVFPEPEMNLELCRALAIMTFLDAFTDEAPDWKLDWILQFAIDAESQLESAASPDGEPGPAPEEMPPEGMPMDPAAGPMPPEALYAPPDAPPMPAGAVPPEVMAPVPQV